MTNILQLSCYTRDMDRVVDKGYFSGYNNMVWGVIILQAAGGLVRI